MDPTQICPHCQTVSPSTSFFCPNCGNKLQEKPISTTLGTQIIIYLVSFLLPPFGLSPAFKRLKQQDPKEKIIGVICILLTIASIVISIIIVGNFMVSLGKLYNGGLDSSYKGLGF